MTGTEAVPIVAWEQAAIVVLFIFFCGGLLAWFGKQSDKWQKFMFDIDATWRQFSKEQREQNNCAMQNVEGSLKDLTTVTQALVSEVKEMRSDTSTFFSDFQQHDAQAKEILAQVQKPVPKPRVPKKPAE